MAESSKILTVSYGTFSCTLEGFDDSFGTMKAIAEYFRDLAERDRYFGAEPPAPDAEMLTRIAEQEIERRVEAHADESGIVLRATDTLQSAPMMPPVATPPDAEAVADAAPIAEEDAVEAAEATPDVEESSPPATADVEEDVAGPEAEDENASTLVASSPATQDVADDLDMDTEEMDITAPASSFADMDASTISEVPAHPDADSVAAKLQRIRAVVGSGAAASSAKAEDDSFASDEIVLEDTVSGRFDTAASDVDWVEDETADEEDETVDEIDAADTAADVEAEDVAETEAEVAADDKDVAAQTDADDTAEDDTSVEAIDVEVEGSADEEEAQQPQQNFRARILRVAKKPAAASVVADAVSDAASDVTDTVQASDDTSDADIADDLDADITESLAQEGIFDDIDDLDVAELAQDDAAIDATLSDEDEAALMADLAEVALEEDAADADLQATDDNIEDVADILPEDLEETAEDIADDAPSAPSGRDILPEADDAAMSRIMDQADQQLSEPEGSRRRSAIAQLKAAVAATEAARQLGDKGDDAAAKESAFRDDLNDAVRPRPASDLPRTEARKERPRPAPLKLVASQRVGEEDAAAEAGVQPRRVASDQNTADVGSFADFASEMGATELPDLLEAAAAYTAYVEGIEDFSRPQIMKKVQASAAQEFSREDGLRSFGTLLRQGRISKVRNGRFQVSDQTRFKPAQKAG